MATDTESTPDLALERLKWDKAKEYDVSLRDASALLHVASPAAPQLDLRADANTLFEARPGIEPNTVSRMTDGSDSRLFPTDASRTA